MAKKPVNFRLDDDVLGMLDSLVMAYSAEMGFKLDRTKVIEKLIMDNAYGLHKERTRGFNPLRQEDRQQSSSPE